MDILNFLLNILLLLIGAYLGAELQKRKSMPKFEVNLQDGSFRLLDGNKIINKLHAHIKEQMKIVLKELENRKRSRSQTTAEDSQLGPSTNDEQKKLAPLPETREIKKLLASFEKIQRSVEEIQRSLIQAVRAPLENMQRLYENTSSTLFAPTKKSPQEFIRDLKKYVEIKVKQISLNYAAVPLQLTVKNLSSNTAEGVVIDWKISLPESQPVSLYKEGEFLSLREKADETLRQCLSIYKENREFSAPLSEMPPGLKEIMPIGYSIKVENGSWEIKEERIEILPKESYRSLLVYLVLTGFPTESEIKVSFQAEINCKNCSKRRAWKLTAKYPVFRLSSSEEEKILQEIKEDVDRAISFYKKAR